MAAPTLPRHTECRYITPEHGFETVGSRVLMAAHWRQGRHAHLALAHGLYGVGCTATCGTKEWKP